LRILERQAACRLEEIISCSTTPIGIGGVGEAGPAYNPAHS
jgi:hypothetical protein